MASVLTKIGAVDYPVVNWDAAKKFWGETIGLPVVWASDEFGWAEYGEENQCHIAIHRAEANHKTNGNHSVVAIFYVDDAFKTADELRAKGVKCDDVVVVPTVVAYARCYDAEGNEFQIAGQPPKA
jgi:predicted enzyme related to lactoylglutathione lyase